MAAIDWRILRIPVAQPCSIVCIAVAGDPCPRLPRPQSRADEFRLPVVTHLYIHVYLCFVYTNTHEPCWTANTHIEVYPRLGAMCAMPSKGVGSNADNTGNAGNTW